MATQLTAEGARQSLTAHVAAKGAELFAKYGPRLGWAELQRLLEDRAQVRYPCEIQFDASSLQPGEFAYPMAKGETPEAGFILYVHPVYMLELDRVAWLVLYQLVAVNYGAFASADDAEAFGAAALGITRDEYYAGVCELADRLAVGEPAAAHMGGDGESGGCNCGSL
ncbi:MAG: hypothetical protein Q7S40_26365 [Opitutaceae bacterium]|nr:hypothetical protein [Opitutaceae bacterium]